MQDDSFQQIPQKVHYFLLTYRIYQRAININVGVVVIIKEENRKCSEWKF